VLTPNLPILCLPFLQKIKIIVVYDWIIFAASLSKDCAQSFEPVLLE
jgi:hypothetical protein